MLTDSQKINLAQEKEDSRATLLAPPSRIVSRMVKRPLKQQQRRGVLEGGLSSEKRLPPEKEDKAGTRVSTNIVLTWGNGVI